MINKILSITLILLLIPLEILFAIFDAVNLAFKLIIMILEGKSINEANIQILSERVEKLKKDIDDE